MSKRNRPSGQRLKEIRHSLAALKKAGLWSGDARAAKGGWRQVKLINDNKDVLAGKAKTVKISKKDRASVTGNFRTHRDRVVVPVRNKDEKIRYNKKDKTFTSTITMYGRKWRKHIVAQRLDDVAKLPDPPAGKRFYYGFRSKSGGGIRPSDKQEFLKLLNQYQISLNRIADVVEILELMDDDSMSDDEADDDE